MKILKNRLKEKIENVYLFEGEDYYLYEKGLAMIKKSAGLEFEEFNFAVFDDENFSIKAVIDSTYILPMGCEKRIILLKNITKITENDKKKHCQII